MKRIDVGAATGCCESSAEALRAVAGDHRQLAETMAAAERLGGRQSPRLRTAAPVVDEPHES